MKRVCIMETLPSWTDFIDAITFSCENQIIDFLQDNNCSHLPFGTF